MIVDIENLAELCRIIKAIGKTIALTNGTFDLLHAGHVEYLQQASKVADVLIVGINSDASVQKYKSPLRPIVSQDERAIVVDAIKGIDFVSIFAEPTAEHLIELVQPHFYIKGADYTRETLPETAIVERYHGEIVFIPFRENCSSTRIINKIASISTEATVDGDSN